MLFVCLSFVDIRINKDVASVYSSATSHSVPVQHNLLTGIRENQIVRLTVNRTPSEYDAHQYILNLLGERTKKVSRHTY